MKISTIIGVAGLAGLGYWLYTRKSSYDNPWTERIVTGLKSGAYMSTATMDDLKIASVTPTPVSKYAYAGLPALGAIAVPQLNIPMANVLNDAKRLSLPDVFVFVPAKYADPALPLDPLIEFRMGSSKVAPPNFIALI